ncbi:pantetheine-phosphate adenylyltransferase [Promethearchaeum syntrophicum]|uniref:Pantetheine-phosphate adenylyltransferase n=1 Tax=Promethearchaeum syntrophicum TaxID=2594042 RepID=A0A5B9DFE2_9ARCH|nr:pantetheine-phosphate adenylyltransferase [Candidatus Prometheoarchaeum syntrophicum]QEE17844.1 Phosphopantetheine adenylyltransferase [Candidatus Prometheoarchaeum syntrophicum]
MADFPRNEFIYDLIGLGGTFDQFHLGHAELIKTAFRFGKHVAIGLTTEKLLDNKIMKEKIHSYTQREQNLKKYIQDEIGVSKQNYTIIPLNDPFGPAITDENLQAHVSSMETYKIAIKINEIRIKKGLPPLVLIVIPIILNQSGNKYSSSEIRKNS